MASQPNFFRTPPGIINLRFQVILVAQYQGKKGRLAEGKQKGWDVSADEAYVTSRRWQYDEAIKAIKSAPPDILAEALTGVKLGRAHMKGLSTAGVGRLVTKARRAINTEG